MTREVKLDVLQYFATLAAAIVHSSPPPPPEAAFAEHQRWLRCVVDDTVELGMALRGELKAILNDGDRP